MSDYFYSLTKILRGAADGADIYERLYAACLVVLIANEDNT